MEPKFEKWKIMIDLKHSYNFLKFDLFDSLCIAFHGVQIKMKLYNVRSHHTICKNPKLKSNLSLKTSKLFF